MTCPHCNTKNTESLPFTRAIDGGRAFAQTCTGCGHILGIRGRMDGDPPATPPELNATQVARLHFVKWLLQNEAEAQIAPLDAA